MSTPCANDVQSEDYEVVERDAHDRGLERLTAAFGVLILACVFWGTSADRYVASLYATIAASVLMLAGCGAYDAWCQRRILLALLRNWGAEGRWAKRGERPRYGLHSRSGIIVTSTLPDGLAEQLGLAPEDAIPIHRSGLPVTHTQRGAGVCLELSVLREGRAVPLTATVSRVPLRLQAELQQIHDANQRRTVWTRLRSRSR